MLQLQVRLLNRYGSRLIARVGVRAGQVLPEVILWSRRAFLHTGTDTYTECTHVRVAGKAIAQRKAGSAS